MHLKESDQIENQVKPPLPGPRNKKGPVLAFDFDDDDGKLESKFNQTSKHLFGGIGQAIEEMEEEGLSD